MAALPRAVIRSSLAYCFALCSGSLVKRSTGEGRRLGGRPGDIDPMGRKLVLARPRQLQVECFYVKITCLKIQNIRGRVGMIHPPGSALILQDITIELSSQKVVIVEVL